MDMQRRIKWVLVGVFFFGLLVAFKNPAEKYFDIAKSLDIFATLFKEVNAYYVDEVEPQKLIRKSIDGMLESLDPYTDYIPEDEMESFRIATTGQYGGIGALIGVVNKKTVITEPYENFPAYQAGLKVGDEIITIDGKNVKGKSITDVSSLLKGQPKTMVEITVRRYGAKEDLLFKIKREKINISNLSYQGMVTSDVGYIRLDDFTPGAGKEVSHAVTSLKEKGAKKIILDLRENPGGLLHEAVNVVSIFIPKGEEVVTTKGKVAEWNKTYNTLNTPVDTTIPLVVLTNDGSASASEIVAGALQDYDRAVLVGQRTFGKGLVQTTRSLSYNAELKVTTAKYYIPSGRCIQELDYTHRHEDGTVDKIADSLRAEFKTRHGRKVYDGGGLNPDVPVKDQYLGTVTVSLINSGLIFDYATKYCTEHSAPANYNSFSLSDKDYSEFTNWLTAQKFSYTTDLEKDAGELIATSKKERYYSELEPFLNSLKNKIESDKANDLIRFKNEIKEELEREIAFHFGYHEGEAAYALSKDEYVLQAEKILNDSVSYRNLLIPN